MPTDALILRVLSNALADHPDSPDTLLPWVSTHALIRRLLIERDEGWQSSHDVEAAGLHWRLRLMYGELGGYPFGDATGARYYHGYDLYQAARHLARQQY